MDSFRSKAEWILAQSHQTLRKSAIDQWSATTSIKDNQDHLMMTFTLRYIAMVIAIVIVTLLMSENCELRTKSKSSNAEPATASIRDNQAQSIEDIKSAPH